MKKFLCVALCLLAVLLTGCKGNEPSPAPESSQLAETGAQPYQIGLVQYAEHAALNTAREAFMSRLEEWSYDETLVEIEYQNAQGDEKKLAEICQGFVDDGMDMIVAVSTPAAKAAVEAAQGTQVKVLFAAVGDPQGALGIADLEKPEGNVTGVSDRTEISRTVDLARQATPSVKTLGLLHSGEETAVAAATQAKAYAESQGLAVVEKSVAGAGELEQAVTELCGQADAILTAEDSLVASSAETVAQAAQAAGKAWYAGGDSQLVQKGALAGVSVDYTQVGNQCADMAVQIMAGRPVSELPVYFFTEPTTYVNLATQEALGVGFPAEVLDAADFYS